MRSRSWCFFRQLSEEQRHAVRAGGDWAARQRQDDLLPRHGPVHARARAQGAGPCLHSNSTKAPTAAPPLVWICSRGAQVVLVNLDPANDAPAYPPDIDIADLVDLSSVMQARWPATTGRAAETCLGEAVRPPARPPSAAQTPRARLQELGLGPNGGLLYCMDYLEQNMDWLHDALKPFEKGSAARREGAPPPLPARSAPAMLQAQRGSCSHARECRERLRAVRPPGPGGALHAAAQLPARAAHAGRPVGVPPRGGTPGRRAPLHRRGQVSAMCAGRTGAPQWLCAAPAHGAAPAIMDGGVSDEVRRWRSLPRVGTSAA